MNEDFKVNLSTILDNSSVQNVKQTFSDLKKEVNDSVKETANKVKETADKYSGVFRALKIDVDFTDTNSINKAISRLQDQIDNRQLVAKYQMNKGIIDKSALENIERYKEALSYLNSLLPQTEQSTKTVAENTEEIKENAEELNPNFEGVKEVIKSIGEESKKVVKSVKNLALSLIGVRSLYSGIRKAMNTYLAQNDELQAKINASWYALGSLFAPILEYIINLFIKLVAYINYVAKALGFAGINMTNFGKSSAKAAKQQKQLASFDEINNLTTNDDSGSGTGGIGNPIADVQISNKFKDIIDIIKENIYEIEAILGGALLALGAVLVFTGADIPLGLGLMISGALLLGHVVKENYGIMSDRLKGVLSTILGLVMGAFLAIGLILIATGTNVPLGIGLVIAGIVGFATAIALQWNSTESKISLVLKSILGLVSGAVLAIGAILLFTGANIPLGIGLLVAGALTLGANLAVNWKTLETKIGNVLRAIALIVGTGLVAVGAILLLTGAGIPLGLGLIIAGLGSLYASSTVNWDALGKKLSGAWDSIKRTASEKWNAIKNTISEKVDGAKDKITTGFNTAKDNMKASWDQAKIDASNAWSNIKGTWNSVTSWFSSNVSNPIKNKIKEAFGNSNSDAVNGYTNIKRPFNNASNDFTTISNTIKTKLSDSFTGLTSIAQKAWESVSNVFNANTATSQGIISKIKNLFASINPVINASVNVPSVTLNQSGNTINPAKKNTKTFTAYALGTDYVPNDQLAFLHKGEAVIPAEYNGIQGNAYTGNKETNDLIRQFMDMVQSKEFRAIISQNEVGRTAVNYINTQRRITGGDLV